MIEFLSLNILIFSPLLAAAIIASPLFGTNQIYIRRFAKMFFTCHFIYSLMFLVFFYFGIESYYNELSVFGKGWLNKLGISAAFGVDSFTVILLILTSLVFLLASVASKTVIRTKHKMYYSLLLLLFCTTLGIFCAKDMFVFLIFWQAEFVPLYFLISEWGSADCRESAMKYLLAAFTGSMLLTIAMIGLYFYSYYANGTLSSTIDFLRIYSSDGICPLFLQELMFWTFFVGFAVKLPAFPLHTQYVNVQAKSVMPVNMVLSAVLVNTAAYGIVRFNFELFPDLFTKYAPFIMLIGVLNILWATLAACSQNDIKKVVAYSNISYMGLFLLGLSSLNKTGIDGALFIMLAQTVLASGLFFVVGYVAQTLKTQSLLEISGIGTSMPRLMFLAYIVAFGVMGIPLTIGFTGDFLCFAGAFSADFPNGDYPKILVSVAVLFFVITAVYLLRMFHGVFCRSSVSKKLYDISGHRLTVLAVLCFCIVLFGCFPDTLMSIYNNVSDLLVESLRV